MIALREQNISFSDKKIPFHLVFPCRVSRLNQQKVVKWSSPSSSLALLCISLFSPEGLLASHDGKLQCTASFSCFAFRRNFRKTDILSLHCPPVLLVIRNWVNLSEYEFYLSLKTRKVCGGIKFIPLISLFVQSFLNLKFMKDDFKIFSTRSERKPTHKNIQISKEWIH